MGTLVRHAKAFHGGCPMGNPLGTHERPMQGHGRPMANSWQTHVGSPMGCGLNLKPIGAPRETRRASNLDPWSTGHPWVAHGFIAQAHGSSMQVNSLGGASRKPLWIIVSIRIFLLGVKGSHFPVREEVQADPMCGVSREASASAG